MDPRGALEAAEECLGGGKLDEAGDLFNRVLEADRTSANAVAAYVGLARLSLALDRGAKAELFARLAERIDPANGEAQTILGLVALANGEDGRALALLARGAELAPDTFRCVFNCGRALKEKGLFAEAIPHLKKAVELEPRNEIALFLLGDARKETGELDKAAVALGRALKLSPDNVAIAATLAEVHVLAKNMAAARGVIEGALDRSPYDTTLLENAATIACFEGRTKDAIGFTRRKLAKDDADPVAWERLATLLLLTDPAEAESAARTLVEGDPRSASARYHLAYALEVLDRRDEAEAEYRRTVDLDPRHWKALANLGRLLATSDERKRKEEAIAVLERAAAAAPAGEWLALGNLALSYVNAHARPRALATIGHVVSNAPRGDPAAERCRVLAGFLAESFIAEWLEIQSSGGGASQRARFDEGLADWRDLLAREEGRVWKHLKGGSILLPAAKEDAFEVAAEPGVLARVACTGQPGKKIRLDVRLTRGKEDVFERTFLLDDDGRALIDRGPVVGGARAFLGIRVRRNV